MPSRVERRVKPWICPSCGSWRTRTNPGHYVCEKAIDGQCDNGRVLVTSKEEPSAMLKFLASLPRARKISPRKWSIDGREGVYKRGKMCLIVAYVAPSEATYAAVECDKGYGLACYSFRLATKKSRGEVGDVPDDRQERTRKRAPTVNG